MTSSGKDVKLLFMMKMTGMILVFQVVLCGAIFAEEKLKAEEAKSYVLAKKERHLPLGSVVEESNEMAMKDADLEIKMEEQLIEGAMMMSLKEVERTEYLEEGKYRVTLLKSENIHKMIINGEPAPMPKEENEMIGKPVILTMKDGAWSGELEEGEANADQQEEIEDIADDFNNNSDLKAYGDVPRKVGDEWESDGAEVFGVDDMEGKIKLKFDRVEKFRGVECAVLVCRFKVTGTDEDLEGAEMMMAGKATIYRSLKDLVDIHAEFSGKMDMNGLVNPEPGMNMEMKINGKMKMKHATKVTRP